MKKILFGALASSALLLSACSTSAEVASTEAGRIREDDLYEAMKNEKLQGGMTIGETVLQKMLIEEIFEHSYGDQVSDDKIDAELEEVAEQYGGIEEYESIIEAQGMDIDAFKKDIRLTLLIQEAIKDHVEITDEEIEEAYEDLKPDATVQHILVEDEELAKDLIQQLEDGADFSELVSEHTEDPGSMDTEGIYSFSEGEMVPEFEEAAFALDEGETTVEPVESDHGYHVIRRLELDYAPLEEQREDLETVIIDGYTQDQEFMVDLVSKLAEKANVRIADDELKGAMAMYMTPKSEDAIDEEDSDATEEELDDSTEDEETEE